MTVNVSISVPLGEKNGINVYTMNKENETAISGISVSPGETRIVPVWKQTFLEIYEQGPSGAVEDALLVG